VCVWIWRRVLHREVKPSRGGDQLSRVALVEERRAGLHAADGVLDERHGRPGQTA
jgi:hypothetical protein